MLFNQTNEVYICYSAKRKSSKDRKIDFDMSFETFAALKKQTKCQYSGIPFDDTEHVFSFERINNNIGYIDGNVIAVSKAINSARSNYTIERLAEMINSLTVDQTHKERVIAAPAKLYPTNFKPRVNPNDPKYKDLIRAWDSQNRAIVRRNRLIDDHIQMLKTDKPARIKARMRSLEKHRQLLGDETAKLAVTRDKLLTLYRKFKRAPVRTSRPNIVAETWNSTQERRQVELNQNAQRTSKRIEYLKFALMGLMRFENLSYHDELCVKFGVPLDTPHETVMHIKGYRECML